jgi:hypothetical protein
MRLSKRSSRPRTRGRRTVIVPQLIARRRGLPAVAVADRDVDAPPALVAISAQELAYLLFEELLQPGLDLRAGEHLQGLERRGFDGGCRDSFACVHWVVWCWGCLVGTRTLHRPIHVSTLADATSPIKSHTGPDILPLRVEVLLQVGWA